MKNVLTIVPYGMYNMKYDYLFLNTATFYTNGDLVVFRYSSIEEVMDIGNKL